MRWKIDKTNDHLETRCAQPFRSIILGTHRYRHSPPVVCEWTWSNPAYGRVWAGLWSVPKNWDFVFFPRARNPREWCLCSTCNRPRWSDRFSSRTPCTCSAPAFSSRCRLYAPGCLRWCAAAALRQINRENYITIVYYYTPGGAVPRIPGGDGMSSGLHT